MNTNIPLINVTEVMPESQSVLKAENSAQHKSNKASYVTGTKIYVRQMTGFFQGIRKYSVSFLLLMYFSFAWIKIKGVPLILFDLVDQKFHLFGLILWPQDFTLLAFALIICAFGLFFITSLFGRVWCGYSCPQTAWSFMFIWLEEFFEGSRQQRIKLDESSVNLNKIAKKTAKHVSWLFVSAATAITFVGYFYPIRELVTAILTLSLDSGVAWFWLIFFTTATYLNAGWLREKVCIYMCPYARFQSVMFNENTMVVGYDEKRGESRGSRSRNEKNSDLGDCIDCQMCVQVCPVGIDIRDGLQYECIGCALCIDACDSIMDKMNYQKGLIRYASEVEFEQGKPTKKFDARAIAYGLILLVSIGMFANIMITRPQAELSVLRDRGALYNLNGIGQVENYYTLKIVNKREVEDIFTLLVEGVDTTDLSYKSFTVGPGEVKMFPVTVSVDQNKIMQSTNLISFIVQSQSASDINAKAESKFLASIYQ
ncbi:MAG: cytochrome c oxidase accessory protein FixG [Oleiphilaceae bacterium]|jgi:cytochrome c oxidase accessory protein FixG